MSKLSRAKGRRHKNGRVKEQQDAAIVFATERYGATFYRHDERQPRIKSPRDYQGKGYGK